MEYGHLDGIDIRGMSLKVLGPKPLYQDAL